MTHQHNNRRHRMKRLLVATLVAVPLAGGLLLAAPAQAASENRALVFMNGVGFLCHDGYGNATTHAVKVATKSGNVNLTCHFLAGETNWPVGTRYSESGVDDCFTHDFYGNLVALDSHFEVTPNGAAIMTCS
jgi:hypothetical protein